jgi:hypothetical protein
LWYFEAAYTIPPPFIPTAKSGEKVAKAFSAMILSKVQTLACFRLILILVSSCVCIADDLPNVPDALKVFPESIHVSAKNPSQLLIYLEKADGSLVSVRDSTSVAITFSNPEIAELATDGRITFRGVGATTVNISYRDQIRSVQVTAIADSPVTFFRDVSGVIGKSGCNLGTCHGSLHGKAGFRLSLRGDDPGFDYDRIVNEYGGRRIDPFHPDESLLLLKATGKVAHQGGRRFAVDSESYRHIKEWIQLGSTKVESPVLTRLQMLPEVARIDHGQQTAPMLVVAHFADGTTRDVTRWSRLEPNVPDGATFTDDGTIRVNRSIDLSIGASYLNGRTAGRFTFLGTGEHSELSGSLPHNQIDNLVEKQLAQMRIQSASPIDDTTFLRRVYLVTVGKLPTSQQTRTFLADSKPNKRAAVVDELLADHNFDLTWALRWSDLLRNEDKVMSSRGTGLFHQWLTQQIASDRPWNEWTAELVGSVGSTYDNPPASFHRTHRDPMTAAESIGQVFLGVRIQCAKCHNHPFDSWRQDDYYGLSAYFTTIHRKQIDNMPKDKLDVHEITGDEIISLDAGKAEIYHPGRSKTVSARPLRKSLDEMQNNTNEPLGAGLGTSQTPLTELAHWLTQDNDMFDRNMANRIWFQYFGSGIVDPPDDFRDSNPPSNPELLDYLAKEFRRSGYSLRTLSRMILTSETFSKQGALQREESVSESSLIGTPFFSDYRIRRLSAESLIDAISAVTDIPSDYPSANGSDSMVHRAMEMPGIPKGTGFLRTFGKPNRLLICECERSNQVSLVQSLALANGPEVQNKITSERNIVGQLLSASMSPESVIEEIYLRAISRTPNESEWRAFRNRLSSSDDPRGVLEDVLWAVINSKEFVMIR